MMLIDIRKLFQRFMRRGFAKERAAVPLPFASAPPPAFLPATHRAAALGLVDMAVVRSLRYRRREHSVSWEGTDADMTRFQTAFIKELKARGMPFFVHALYRNKADQDRMYRNAVSKAKWGQSAHNFGMAADIVHFGRYWDLTRKEWEVIGLIGKEVARRTNIKIEWGGDWSFYDPAHWELADWRDRIAMSAA